MAWNKIKSMFVVSDSPAPAAADPDQVIADLEKYQLPAETPREVKKQIVEASLKAFGYPVEKIIESGAMEIQALEIYIQSGQKDTQSLLVESQKRLAELDAEIGRVKKVMDDQVAAQFALTNACNDAKLKVQEVLEFFGQEAVARVVKESPRLHEPRGSGAPTK